MAPASKPLPQPGPTSQSVARSWRSTDRFVPPHDGANRATSALSSLGGGGPVRYRNRRWCTGHSSPNITREFYIARPAITADVSDILQTLAPQEQPPTLSRSNETQRQNMA